MESKVNIREAEYRPRFGYGKHVFFDSVELRQSGAKFQVIVFQPDGIVEPHFHEKVVEIFLTLSGSGAIKINDTVIPCESGDIVLCEPGDVHSFFAETEWTIAIFKTNEDPEDIRWLGSTE